jgi:hypothetical protein
MYNPVGAGKYRQEGLVELNNPMYGGIYNSRAVA